MFFAVITYGFSPRLKVMHIIIDDLGEFRLSDKFNG